MLQNHKKKNTQFHIFSILLSIYIVAPRYLDFFNFNVLNILSILILIVSFPTFRKLNKNNLKYYFSELFFFFLYYLFVMVRYFVDGNAIEGVAYLLNNVIVCLCILKNVNSYGKFKNLIRTILIFSFAISIYGVIECIFQTNILFSINENPYIEIRNGIWRISTTFDHPIVYGSFILLCINLTLYMILNNNKKRANQYKILYILLFINLICTVSRAAIIITSVSQIAFIYFNKNKSNINSLLRNILFPISLGVMVLFVFISGDSSGNIIVNVFTDFFLGGIKNVSAFGDRLLLYGWTWELTKNNVWFGNGASAEFLYNITEWSVKTSCEVEYLNCFFRFGIVGLALKIISFITVLKGCKLNIKYKRIENFQYFCLIAFVSYFILLFGVTQQSDVRIFNTMVCLMFVYKTLIKRGTFNYDNRINGV